MKTRTSPTPRRQRWLLPVIAIILGLAAPAGATTIASKSAQPALERPWAAGAYGTSWHGTYDGQGLGGLLRWEAFPGTLGLEVFGNRADVRWPTSRRVDDVVGFTLFTPLRLHDRLRLRLGAGFCSMLSRIDPLFEGGPRDDAILFGAHADAGVDWALSSWVSLFGQTRGFVYHGTDRTGDGEVVRGQLTFQPAVQIDVGLSFHFGG
ncbi:MAG: hypothetical protein KC502_03725 [Myxococcales bacterium]|nr:hypothetical protein [Myxococcales bacterium]